MQRLRATSPREVALAMLDARFGVAENNDATAGLAKFQQDAVTRVRAVLRRRRGVILADSVGLGKTHVAAALVSEMATAGRNVLVCGPAVLQAHWRRQLRRVRGWQWCSHASLSRGRSPSRAGGWQLIVVDEAHAFRNPKTRRYRTLADLCTEADVLLLTATPVNNSILDFYHLIRLFCDDARFRDLGVPDLRAAFDAALHASDAPDVRRIAEAVMVRRTRAFIARNYPVETTRPLRFPETAPIRTLRYNLDAGYGDVATLLRDMLALRFPAHLLSGDVMSVALLRLNLLKRLESSAVALTASLQRLVDLMIAVDAALAKGFLLDAREYRDLIAKPGADRTQLLLDAAVLRPVPNELDRERVRADVAHELRTLHDLLARCAVSTVDPKLALLREQLRGELAGERVLIFTEYRETARALWRELRGEFRAALIHGGDAYLGAQRASRRAVLDRFAPHANGVRAPPPREQVDVLIATDVLAEGLNLQDARIVISYDLPWNPVRIAQRVGRVDRLGSPHARIEALTFVPDQRVESLLGVMRRLRRKLRAIRMIGGDAPVFGARTDASQARVPLQSAAHTSVDTKASYRRSVRTGAFDATRFDAHRPEWEIVETLRLEHRRARARVTATASDDVPVASLQWPETRAAVLCCVATGAVVRWRLVEQSGEVREGDAAVDRALLRALQECEVAAPTSTKQLHRATIAAARDVAPKTQSSNDQSRRRAATLVHRWLSARPLGASAADYARADRLLVQLQLSPPESVPGEGGMDERLARLEREMPPVGAPLTAEPRLVAALELVPADWGPTIPDEACPSIRRCRRRAPELFEDNA